jgi:uncharacterized lipoprotein
MKGLVQIGDFRYLPSENNLVKPNQIRNSAQGYIFLDKNVDEYFKTALLEESNLIGITPSAASNTITGEIVDFFIDDLGFSADWTLEVKYIVSRDITGQCYNKIYKIHKNKTAKFTNFVGVLNDIMKRNIEKIFLDKDFLNCIAS